MQCERRQSLHVISEGEESCQQLPSSSSWNSNNISPRQHAVSVIKVKWGVLMDRIVKSMDEFNFYETIKVKKEHLACQRLGSMSSSLHMEEHALQCQYQQM